MKALILAAGYGTRLRPYTRQTPKSLFPVGGRPVLERVIMQLTASGCSEIVINTHHLSSQIEAFIADKHYPIAVHTRFEPHILGTGGAIRNTSDILGDRPFMVVNSDIVTDIDLKAVYDFHQGHRHPATLVLHDRDEFNAVSVTEDGFISAFHAVPSPSAPVPERLAFTGIQMLDPELIDLIPQDTHYSSIDLYRHMITRHMNIKAYVVQNHFWTDIGTPARYRDAAYQFSVRKAFETAFPDCSNDPIHITRLAGDGSDRSWFRLTSGSASMVMADHGIREASTTAQVDSFIHINQHLASKDIPVPAIYLADAFSGLVYLEDLGDIHLQQHVAQLEDRNRLLSVYQRVIDILIRMSISCVDGFDPGYTYQTADYNQDLILEKECRYFVEAFLQGYRHLDIAYDQLENDFISLSEKALAHAFTGFMHRDFQSRNIMLRENQFYVIDVQGARIGPLQYDLASLLLDPYVALPAETQSALLAYALKSLSSATDLNEAAFHHGYIYCSLTRNLQILGAFGYLGTVKKKPFFRQYIPAALISLRRCLEQTDPREFSRLKSVVKGL